MIEDCILRREVGRWRMEDRMEDEGWMIENGGWRIDGWMEYLREAVK